MSKITFALLVVVCLCALGASAQTITMYAGTWSDNCSGIITPDGTPATNAELCHIGSMVVSSTGNLFFHCDHGSIREVTPDGVLHTPSFNDTIVSSVQTPIAIDKDDNIYAFSHFCIYKITPSGVVSVCAGIPNVSALSGEPADGSVATAVPIGNNVTCITTDRSGNVYFVDGYYQSIYKISNAGIFSRYAGDGAGGGYSGDNGPATIAQFNGISSIACDSVGNLFVSDAVNNRIRKVDANTHIVSTYVLTNTGYGGDGGPAIAAGYTGIVQINARGNDLYISEDDARIRRISTTGIINTVAGTGTVGFSGDGGPAIAANIQPNHFCVAPSGDFYIAHGSIYVIRKISGGYLTGVNNLDRERLNIYPNPSSGRFKIDIPSRFVEGHVYLTDVLGREVYRQDIKNVGKVLEIENNRLDAGNYMLIIRSDQGNITSFVSIVK